MLWKLGSKHVVFFSILTVMIVVAACAPAAAPPTPTPPPPTKAAAPAAPTAAPKPTTAPAAAPTAAPKPATPPTPVALEKLNIGLTQISPNQSIFAVTKEAGLFQKHGLDVTLVLIEGGAVAMSALASGDVKFEGQSGLNVVNAALSGVDVIQIASVTDRFTDVMVGKKAIEKAADLKGKIFGVGQLGTTPDFEARLALRDMGLDPEKDLSVRPVGGESARIAALLAGGIDAALVDVSLAAQMKSQGLNILYNFLDSSVRFQNSNVAMTKAYAKQNPETVRKFMRAFVEGIKFYKANKAQTVNMMMKWLKMDDKSAVEQAYDLRAKIMPQKPYASVNGMKLVIDFAVLAGQEKAKTAKPGDFYDDSFVKELDQSGFIDGLYR